jgi:hypothetical protein
MGFGLHFLERLKDSSFRDQVSAFRLEGRCFMVQGEGAPPAFQTRITLDFRLESFGSKVSEAGFRRACAVLALFCDRTGISPEGIG